MKNIMLPFEQSIGINFIQSYCRRLYLYSPGGTSAVRSHHRLRGSAVLWLFIYLFSSAAHAQIKPLDRFWRIGSKCAESRKDVPFWG